MTPKEFDATPPNCFKPGFRYEIINGVLVVSPPVSIAESDPNDELGYLLRTYQETSPEGKALDRTVPERYVPGTPNRRRCDRAIWTGLGRIPDVDHDVPSIVVEFVSSRKRDALRDYEDKRDEYLAAGVKEYWIIDRFMATMTVFRRVHGKVRMQVIEKDGVYKTDLLPGFELPLARLFALAAQWSEQPE